MAEIWGAAIAVGGAALSGYAKSKQEKEARKNANSDAKAANKDEAKWSSLVSAFEKEQDYRYEQMNRQNKQRGLEEFRKFNTVNQFAPEYSQTYQGIQVPNAKTVSDFEAEYNAVDAVNNPATTGSKSGKSTLEKIDPLGSGIIKGLKKLF